MNNALPQEGLEEIFDEITREITKCAAGISLCQGDTLLEGDVYTVYAAFERGFQTSLSFCAEAPLFARLTRYMMQEERVTPKDVEDFSKEYFNILCGRLASRLFQVTKIPSRFGIPVFYQGRYVPEGQGEHFIINYMSDENERAQLIHHTPKAVL